MKINESIIQQVANGETTLTGEPVGVAKQILASGMFPYFVQFIQFHDGDSDNILDVSDMLLDFSALVTIIEMPVPVDICASGIYNAIGITDSDGLKNMYTSITEMGCSFADSLEGKKFTISGTSGTYQYLSTYFHYCYGEGAITESELLNMIRA